MGDVKRWSVTYTKHIKQKRKVYQDGFLELHESSHKMMLYDDCEKLLGVRIRKKDDIVRSGESLAFDAYLVDIGDPEGNHKSIPNLTFQGRDKKVAEKSGLFHGKKFKHNSFPVEDRKPNLVKNKAPSSSLSPSQKIIREFKKNEMNKYGAPMNSPDTTKTSYSEWNVLYTTQITQKAKKYHDGILRVAPCGSQGRQATLYDVSRRVLDGRFLKKHEVIGSGESLAFDGHLVDIGEPEGDHKPLMDLKFQERNFTAARITGLSHGQQHSSFVENGNSGSSNSVSPVNCLKSVKTSGREWDALYTTQITQKAKNYHCGVLKFASCGSYRMQATLLNEDGAILSHKYMKLCDDVRSGSTFELPNYLVEVGEPRTNTIGEAPKNACSEKDVASNFSTRDVDNLVLSRRVPKDEPLRDANGIMSILRKPMTQKGSVPIESAYTEQNQVKRHLVQDSKCERSEEHNHDDETSKRQKPVEFDDLTMEVVQSANSQNIGESCLTPLSSFLRSGASNFSSPNSNAECKDKSILRPVTCIEKPQVKLEDPDDLQPPAASVPHDVTNRNMGRDPLELMPSKVSSSCPGNTFSNELKTGISAQPSEESIGMISRQHEGAFSCSLMNSNGRMSNEHNDIKKPSYVESKSPSKMDEIPSFDLGI